jgi:hypothetical protein
MKALLLAGSPGMEKSASEALGRYLLERVAEKGFETSLIRINQTLAVESGLQKILEAVESPDLLVLAYPVYLDSLPYLTTKTLLSIARHRQSSPNPRPMDLMAIATCGLPEAQNTVVGLRICQQFAHQAGMRWLGGLGACMSPMLGSGQFNPANRMVHHLAEALDMAARAAAAGNLIPVEAVEIMAKPVMPAGLYRSMMNYNFERRTTDPKQS